MVRIPAQCWIMVQFRVGALIYLVSLVILQLILVIQNLPLREVLGLVGQLFRSQQALIIHAHFWTMVQFHVGVETREVNLELETPLTQLGAARP